MQHTPQPLPLSHLPSVYCVNPRFSKLEGKDRNGYCDKDSNDGDHDEELCQCEAFILFPLHL